MIHSNPPTTTPHPVPFTQPTQRTVKRCAADILSRPGVRMHMLLSTIILLAVFTGSIYLVENTWFALDWDALYENSPLLYDLLDALLYAIDAVIVLLFGIPLAYGWLRYLYLCATGITPPLSILFFAFGNRQTYLRTLAIMLCMLLHLAVPAAVLCALIWLIRLFAALGTAFGIVMIVLLSIVSAAVAVIGWLLSVGITWIVMLDLNHPDMRIKELFVHQRTLTRQKRSELWLLQLTLLPLWLLGVLTLGTVLLLHSLPLSVICMQRAFCDLTGERLPTVAPEQSSRA